ncbi:MAG: DUF4102 domain-containing protein [SAR324 cluster bacterium]|nr:DUF4102 domain-containing protein [SAR324 cluster bacterium]
MLTEIKIKYLKPKKTEYTISDTHGLSLRILPTGRKAFQYRYHLPGQRSRGRRFTYGQWPDLSLAEVRALHREAVKKVRQGIDLNLEKRAAATQPRGKPRLTGEKLQQYLDKERTASLKALSCFSVSAISMSNY